VGEENLRRGGDNRKKIGETQTSKTGGKEGCRLYLKKKGKKNLLVVNAGRKVNLEGKEDASKVGDRRKEGGK